MVKSAANLRSLNSAISNVFRIASSLQLLRNFAANSVFRPLDVYDHRIALKPAIDRLRDGNSMRTSATPSPGTSNPDTGCPFWLDWAAKANIRPRNEVHSHSPICVKFPPFRG
jgi:hypothetical protein